MVSRLTGYAIQPNKAIVGRNAFAHESGIHQDGVLKERTTYEIMDATEVGLESNSIVLGKHSGRHALRDALEQLGFKVEGNALNSAFKRFKEVADRKKQVTALDLEAIVSDEMRERADSHELAWFEVEAGSRREPLARVAVTMPSGEESVGESSGDGPVELNGCQLAAVHPPEFGTAQGAWRGDIYPRRARSARRSHVAHPRTG